MPNARLPETMTVHALDNALDFWRIESGIAAGDLPVYVALEDGELRRVTSAQLVGTGNEISVVLYAGTPKDKEDDKEDDKYEIDANAVQVKMSHSNRYALLFPVVPVVGMKIQLDDQCRSLWTVYVTVLYPPQVTICDEISGDGESLVYSYVVEGEN